MMLPFVNQGHGVAVVGDGVFDAARTRRWSLLRSMASRRYRTALGSGFSSPIFVAQEFDHFVRFGGAFPLDAGVMSSAFSRKITMSVSSGCFTGLECPGSNAPGAGTRTIVQLLAQGHVQRTDAAADRGDQGPLMATR